MDMDTPRPTEGGSYVVDPDGTLRQVEGPALDALAAEPPEAGPAASPSAPRRRGAASPAVPAPTQEG